LNLEVELRKKPRWASFVLGKRRRAVEVEELGFQLEYKNGVNR
jgi:hypothetical protein